jgi:sugar/nucleoside kinase (ribokinase family)
VSSPKYKNKSWDYLEKMENLLKIIKSWGPKIVVITNGKHGANAYNGIRFYHQPILKEKKIADTTGVGDAFGSTFIAGLKLFNYDIQKAMYISARNTASLVGQPGAQNGLLTKNQILKNIK